MASMISKRQQARNEKGLQDLIKTVPGNDKCADCAARNPGWASWSLGIFLCMRCAALHRKVGTHVTKVKSLSMDSWNNEQVENMKRMGNVRSNQKFNPQNAKPSIPIDVDEVDGVMEKFIRQKYEQRTFSGGSGASARRAIPQYTGSASSIEEQPPPLPPKPGKRFGFSFRSTSSTYPQQQRSPDKFTPPLSPSLSGSDGRSSPKQNKQSRVFGSKIGNGNQDDRFDAKLAALRDMGFGDNRRNSSILKSMNGNLDRTVEALVRLGSIGEAPKPPSRTLTPVSVAGSTGMSGISVQRTRAPEVVKTQGNPFDALDNPPSPRSVTAPLPQVQPAAPPQPTPNQSWNPFQAQMGQTQAGATLQDSFQSMFVSQPQQTTIPPAANVYGAQNPFYANQQASQQQQTQQYQQVATPAFAHLTGQQSHLPASNDHSSNPFIRRVQSQTFAPSNPYAQQQPLQQQPSVASNPWLQQQQPFVQTPQSQTPSGAYQQQADFFSQQPPQAQEQMQGQNMYSNVSNGNPFMAQQQPQQTATPTNPYQSFALPQQQPQSQQTQQPQQFIHQQQQSQPQQAPLQQYPQQPFRHDKSSILALYGQPQLAPSRPLQPLPEDPSISTGQIDSFGQARRSATMPVSTTGGSMNPFAASTGPPQAAGMQAMSAAIGGPRHVSQESADFVGLGAAGRQSPDAFKGLSARFVR